MVHAPWEGRTTRQLARWDPEETEAGSPADDDATTGTGMPPQRMWREMLQRIPPPESGERSAPQTQRRPRREERGQRLRSAFSYHVGHLHWNLPSGRPRLPNAGLHLRSRDDSAGAASSGASPCWTPPRAWRQSRPSAGRSTSPRGFDLSACARSLARA
jgi:hypothetical protein